jgi:small-conductance mechanosensitive channel
LTALPQLSRSFIATFDSGLSNQEHRMRRFAFAAATFVLIATLGCRKQRSNETGGVSDTATTPPAAAIAAEPAAADTAGVPPEFAFDQRQSFVQSIRQQLTDIDRQIKELSAQAKSRGGAVSDRALNNVRAARRTVDRDLSRVNAATAANWEQVRQGVTRSVENLNEAIEVAQPK